MHNISLYAFVGSTKNRRGNEKIARINKRRNSE
jgi:hypothetical protein